MQWKRSFDDNQEKNPKTASSPWQHGWIDRTNDLTKTEI